MKMFFPFSASLILALVVFCFSTSRREVEPRTIAEAPPSAVSETKSKSLPLATAVDVRNTIARVFGDFVVLPDVHRPAFVSNDWNGDGSQDLAVIVNINVKGAAKTNAGLLNWSVQNVEHVELPTAGAAVYTFHQKQPPVTIKNGQRVMAIVHGTGEQGWRSPEAAQAYVLVNAPSKELSTISTIVLDEAGVALPRTTANPEQVVIGESAVGKQALYWTGGQYAAVRLRNDSLLMAQNLSGKK